MNVLKTKLFVYLACLVAFLLTTSFALADYDNGFNYEINDDESITIIEYSGNDTVVLIPESIDRKPVKRIGNNAFDFSGIVEIVIPGSVRSIGDNAFSYCFQLKTVVMDISNDDVEIGVSAFGFDSCIESVSIGAKKIKIGQDAFQFCSSLKDVLFTNNPTVVDVGEGAFKFCTIGQLDIPDSVNNSYDESDEAEPIVASDKWICSNCSNEATGNFCNNCGTKRPDENWICSNCGNQATGNFCSNCGTPCLTNNTANNENHEYEIKTTGIAQSGKMRNDEARFVVFDDIAFGDSKATIKQKETRKAVSSLDNTVLIYHGKVLEIDDSEVNYYFDESEKLETVICILNVTDTAKLHMTTKKISDDLSKTFGSVIKDTKNEYNGFPWKAWEASKELMGDHGGAMLDGQWLVETENGIVLIDLAEVRRNNNGNIDWVICLGYNIIHSNLQEAKAEFTSRPRSNATPRPVETATPKPTAKVSCEISIASVKLDSSSVIPDLYVVFKNDSKVAVDRIDFEVKCYDAYGSQIKGYGIYDSTECFYDQTIQSNQTSRFDYRWYLNGWDGIKSVEIAITRYHKINGKAVIIPEDQRKWVKFTFR